MYQMLQNVHPFNLARGKNFIPDIEAMKAHRISWPHPKRIPHSKAFKDLCTKLLNPDKNERLGANDANEILEHEWFNDIDKDAILAQTV